MNSNTLDVSLSQSMTNTRSDYILTMSVPEIVIDNLL